MNLRETLQAMQEKNNERNFNIAVETMKRKADKGLLEGVSSADIERELSLLEKEKDLKIATEVNLNQEIFELSEAVDKFGYLDIESWSEEDLQEAILYNFLGDVSLLERRDYEDPDDDDERKRKLKKAGIITGASVAGAGLTAGTIKDAVTRGSVIKDKKIKDAYSLAINAAKNDPKNIALATDAASKHLAANAGDYLGATAVHNSTLSSLAAPAGELAKVEAEKGAGTAFGLGMKEIGGKIASGASAVGGAIKNGAKAIWAWGQANPFLAGLGVAGLGLGAAALIRHLYKKRQERMLTENLSDLILFDNDYALLISETIAYLSNDEINFLLENGSEDTKEIISMFQNKKEVLDEAVTYIDNAGNLKTKSVIDYNKDMHEYHTETQIAKYEKKKKKRDYKLISEEIDIDNIKKLSEMSLEDILNEEYDS